MRIGSGVALLDSRAENGQETRSARGVRCAGLVLAAAALVSYFNALSAPFLFDDIPSITNNPTIRNLRSSLEPLASPVVRGAGVAGRPVVNLSLAVNRWLGGEDVWGYHLFNVLVHLGAGLALFGVVRRTLRLGAREAVTDHATPVAFCCALLWLVHPLQTESVTCVIQRTESMVGLFYLLTFYGFIRSAEMGAGRGWAALAVAACWIGAATKEVVATAPLLVFLYDRTFLAGSFRAAWRQRKRLHLALASSWLVVAALVARSDWRGGTVGFGHGVAAWEYALTQCRAVVLYLRLAVWPHPLVLDYGTGVVRDPLAVLPQAGLLVALLAATVVALWRWPQAGFAGAWFFVILAPSSSVVPLVTQTMAEHRMYLPLAAVVTLAMAAVWNLTGRRGLWVAGALAVAGSLVTLARNTDYRTVETIWRDNLAKWPANVRAHYTLAELADGTGRFEEAIAHGEAAVALAPADATAQFSLAFSLDRAGRLEESAAHYREAVRLEPESAGAHINLGTVLAKLGRFDEAVVECASAVRLQADSAENQFNLAQMLYQTGDVAGAVTRYETAARLKPDAAETHFRLGNARVKLGQMTEAVAAFREAVRLAPGQVEARSNLAGALLMLHRPAEAVPVYEEALRLKPADPNVRANLERAREMARTAGTGR